MSVAVNPGSTALNLMPGWNLAYCMVSMVAADLDALYRAMLNGKSGLVVIANEPAALETVTTLGFADLRSRGRAASVTRTMPTALTSKVRSADGPSKGPN